MEFKKLNISDVILISPKVFKDDRGFFYESFNQKEFNNLIGYQEFFVQDNHSFSKKKTLRGLHYQTKPNEQGKLVRVISGEIFDVAVDLRKESSTFGKYVSALLTSQNNHQLWIPKGFAHGFLTLTDNVEVLYKATDFYHKESEITIDWNDNTLNIDWPYKEGLVLSEKDQYGVSFKEFCNDK